MTELAHRLVSVAARYHKCPHTRDDRDCEEQRRVMIAEVLRVLDDYADEHLDAWNGVELRLLADRIEEGV